MNAPVATAAADRTLDLRQAWDALTPGAQAELGMAAIAVGLAQLVDMVEEHEEVPWQTEAAANNTYFFDAAAMEAQSLIGAAVEANVLGGDIGRLRPPSMAALGIRQCTECGCTDQCACEAGCHWIGPLLCSSCGPEAVR